MLSGRAGAGRDPGALAYGFEAAAASEGCCQPCSRGRGKPTKQKQNGTLACLSGHRLQKVG